MEPRLMTLSSKSLHSSHSCNSPQLSQPVQCNDNHGLPTMAAPRQGNPFALVGFAVNLFSETPSNAFSTGLSRPKKVAIGRFGWPRKWRGALDTRLMTLSSKSLHLSHSRKSPQPSQPVRSRHNADSGPRTVGAIHRGKPPASVDVVVTKFSATPSKAFHRGLFHSR